MYDEVYGYPNARAVTVLASRLTSELPSGLPSGLGDREYIAGDRFTVADILLTNTLNWARARERAAK
jgi:glutathione S-transferase